MKAAAQFAGQTYRVVLLHGSGDQLATISDKTPLVLPSLGVPCGNRVAETITSAFKTKCGINLICLFTSAPGSQAARGDDVHYQIAEHWSDSREDIASGRWRQLSELTERAFADQRDYSAIQQAISICNSTAEEASARPFAALGWFKNLRQWIAGAIEPQGFHLGPAFRQLSASPSSALVRLETDGPAVWFKAVGVPNLREFPISILLAEGFPAYVPTMVATKPDCNGWLALEAPGMNLSETMQPACWLTAAGALAGLQMASLGQSPLLLAGGARDLRIDVLSGLLGPFLSTMNLLMEAQPRVSTPVIKPFDLVDLEERIQRALGLFGRLGIPDCLGHLDPNPGNLVVSPGRCRFLDWAEAHVGPPFLTFEYLLEHYRRAGADVLSQAQMEAAYYTPWQQLLSAELVSQAREIAPLLAVFAYAIGCESWLEPELMDEGAAGYYRSLTRRMWREATRAGTYCRHQLAANYGEELC